MPATADEQLLTREEAAEYLGVRPNTLAIWMHAGRYDLPVVKIGRAVRYRLEDLEAFVERHTVTPGSTD